MEKRFTEMAFNEQESIINACMMNHAKQINSLQTINESKAEKNNQNTFTATKTFRDCVQFLYNNHDELFNESYINCIDMMNNPKYNELPIALFVSKACGKAINHYFYVSGKSVIDYSELTEKQIERNKRKYENAFENVNCADCFDSFSDVFDKDRIESIIANIRDDLRKPCEIVIDLLTSGYNYIEIAKIMHINRTSVYKYVSAIANAIAITNAIDKEWNALDGIIASDISLKDKLSRMQLESAIIKAYKAEFNIQYDSVIDWKTALERLKEKAYYESNQSSLASAFYSK